MDSIRFYCPSCGELIDARATQRGDLLVCRACADEVVVPVTPVGPGTEVDGFRIVGRIGTGGMGNVYLAEQTSMGRMVALKVLPPALTQDKTFLERFLSEVRMQGALSHVNIATAYDAGKYGDIYYLAMEYLEGYDLADMIENRKRIEERAALKIVIKVAAGLEYAWEKREIVHRDIKPSNIFICQDTEVKVLDLGVSKSTSSLVSKPTEADTVVGTPHYMSPEQARASSTVDIRADIYSLGATLYHMLTGRPPFIGENMVEVLTHMVEEPAPAIRELNPAISDACARLVEVMMAREPEDRFATWAECRADMRRVLAGRMPAWHRPPQAGSLVAPAAHRRPTPHAATPTAGRQPLSRSGLTVRVAGSLALVVAGLFLLARFMGGRGPGEAGSASADRGPFEAPADPGLDRPVGTAPPVDEAAVRKQEMRVALDREYRDAIAAVDRDPEVLEDHIARFAGLQSRARRLGLGDLASQCDREIEALRQDRQRRVDALLVELDGEAAPLLDAGDYAAAIALYRDVEGALADASGEARNERIADLAVEARADARARFAVFVDKLARTLIAKRSLPAAAALVAESREQGLYEEQEGRLTALQNEIDEAVAMNAAIIESYEAQVGKEVAIDLKRGPKRLIIDRVTGEVIHATERVPQGTIQHEIHAHELSLDERYRRLEAMDEPGAHLMRGLIALALNRSGSARAAFEETGGQLGPAIMAAMEALRREAEEAQRERAVQADDMAADAEDALRDLWGKADLPDDPGRSPVALMEIFLDGRYDTNRRKVIRMTAQQFLKVHGNSAVAKRHENLLRKMATPDPSQQQMLTELHEAIGRANPRYNGKAVITVHEGERRIVGIDLRGAGQVVNFAPLGGYALERFAAAGGHIRNIKALSRMPLKELILENTRVDDLSPAAGMPLESLSLKGSAWIRTLSALRNTELRRLDFAGTRVTDMSVLASMPLADVTVNREVADLGVFQRLPLERLVLDGSKVSTLRPLHRKRSLRELSILDTPITSLRPLQGLSIRTLRFDPARIGEGFQALVGMTTLEHIAVSADGEAMTPEEFMKRFRAGEFGRR